MKKFQYISDIHLEYFGNRKIPNIIPKCDTLLLLGDIGNPRINNYKIFLDDISKKFNKVFLISGNHEYWNLLEHNIKMNINEIDNLINDITFKYNNIIYLNNSKYLLDKTVNIIGCTLWSNIPNYKYDECIKVIGDFENIYYNNKKITPNMINKMHNISKKYIIDNIDKNKINIILTHHCPSYKFLHKKFMNNKYNYAFVSELDYIIKPPIKVWLSGHSHGNTFNIINGVICGINAYGYNRKNNEHINKIVKID